MYARRLAMQIGNSRLRVNRGKPGHSAQWTQTTVMLTGVWSAESPNGRFAGAPPKKKVVPKPVIA